MHPLSHLAVSSLGRSRVLKSEREGVCSNLLCDGFYLKMSESAALTSLGHNQIGFAALLPPRGLRCRARSYPFSREWLRHFMSNPLSIFISLHSEA
nr:putative integron gene cassette protein [uncultured bacterium]CAP48478.1 putative integron gene cassette protein [uncultured bacterium]CAP48479.1 putative integron gene cassette protein [uncultured bacterium]CAP48554.1 putative integron gene cassette protein [uncultured bacterium]